MNLIDPTEVSMRQALVNIVKMIGLASSIVALFWLWVGLIILML